MVSFKSLRAAAAAGICALSVVLGGCGGGGGGGSAAAPVASDATQTISLKITSNQNRSTYPIQVFLPASYKTGNTAYPIIYATDGDDPFTVPGSTRFERFRGVLARRGTDAILVGIGNSADRQIDYNFPGANAYLEFLQSELIPFIESQYRVDGKRRALSGLSTGGSFVLTTFLKQAPDQLTFSYFLSSEAAIWQQTGIVEDLEKALFLRAAGKVIPATLILAHSEQGGNSPYVNAMYRQLASRNYQGLKLSEPAFPYGHAPMDLPAFESAVASLFP